MTNEEERTGSTRRSRDDLRPARSLIALAGLALLVGAATVVGACGAVAAGPRPSASPAAVATIAPALADASSSSAPVPSPPITSGRPPAGAVAVVREFWKLVGQGRLKQAQDSLTSPQSPVRAWHDSGVAAAHFVRVVPGPVGAAPVEGATLEFAVEVWIEPSAAGGAWGPAGVHQLFENVVRMSDDSWRLVGSGTGP